MAFSIAYAVFLILSYLSHQLEIVKAMSRTFASVIAALALLFPAVALAHTGHGAAGGFAHGFVHPIFGMDHVLAMVAVGLFAGQLGGRALWLVPAAFVGVMAVGGALGIAGVTVPAVEFGIALSIVVLGAAVAFRLKAPVVLAMLLVGVFAVFHGHAHGTEMPETMAGMTYGTGFMLATALLHGAGIGLGFVAAKLTEVKGALLMRGVGGAMSVFGLVILAGAI